MPLIINTSVRWMLAGVLLRAFDTSNDAAIADVVEATAFCANGRTLDAARIRRAVLRHGVLLV